MSKPISLVMFGDDPIHEMNDHFEVNPREARIRSVMYLDGCSYAEAARIIEKEEDMEDEHFREYVMGINF